MGRACWWLPKPFMRLAKKNRSVSDIGHKFFSGERANLAGKDRHRSNP